MNGPSVKQLRDETGRAATAAFGAIRRMAITLTAKALWQLTGFNLGDGNVETFNGEVFGGIGFYARPPSSGKPEAIAIAVGGSKTMVVVGVRDEATRSSIAGGINADEAMVFGSQALVYVRNDGTVEIRTPGGSAQALALKSDVDSLASYVDNTLVLAVATTGTASAQTGTATVATSHAPSASGTSVLKGQ